MRLIRSVALILILCLCLPCFALAEEQTYPVTLTDAAGRAVTLEKEPERIVSGYYIATHLLIVLGLKDRLVGVEAKADTRPIYALAAPGILDLPDVGTAKQFDIEGCAALAPDLVILPLKLRDAAQVLEQLGFSVLLVNPESAQQLMDTVDLLCAACNARGDALRGYYARMNEKLAALTADRPMPRVYIAGSEMLRTAGEKMYQNEMLRVGGGENVAAEIPDAGWAEISCEQLLQWDPDAVIISAEAAYGAEDFMNDPMLAELRAVKQGRVYAMPKSLEIWDSPVPGSILGSLWTVSMLHGEVYPFEEFCADAADFYRSFYRIGIDAEMLQ